MLGYRRVSSYIQWYQVALFLSLITEILSICFIPFQIVRYHFLMFLGHLPGNVSNDRSFYARLMNINRAVRTKTLLNVTPWIISISKCSVRFSYISVYFKSTLHYFMLCLNESWWFDIGSGSAVKPTCHECLNSQERLGGWTPSFSLHHLTCFPNR